MIVPALSSLALLPCLALLPGCRTPPAPASPEWASLPAAPCPPGMVLVEGSGVVGMEGDPYGVVQTAGRQNLEAPEQGCAAAIAGRPGAVTCWVQTNEADPVLAPRPVQVGPFCVDAWPFPGPGAAYTRDGLTPTGVVALQRLLQSRPLGGRRLCSFTEWQAAVAGLRGNRRFIYGDDAPGDRCGSDSLETGPIGADARCANPETGVHDYGAVLSHWVLADADFLAFACGEGGGGCAGAGGRTLSAGDPIVAGGTRRVLTRQAPLTPHTWHDHGRPGGPGACTNDLVWDDQPIVCADPDPGWLQGDPGLAAAQADWMRLVAVGRGEGSMAAVLAEGLGRGWCEAVGEPVSEPVSEGSGP